MSMAAMLEALNRLGSDSKNGALNDLDHGDDAAPGKPPMKGAPAPAAGDDDGGFDDLGNPSPSAPAADPMADPTAEPDADDGQAQQDTQIVDLLQSQFPDIYKQIEALLADQQH